MGLQKELDEFGGINKQNAPAPKKADAAALYIILKYILKRGKSKIGLIRIRIHKRDGAMLQQYGIIQF